MKDVRSATTIVEENRHRLVRERWLKANSEGDRELALRMLGIENALYLALEERGHEVELETAILHGETVDFSLYEANRAERVALTKKDWGYDPAHPRSRQVLTPSGRPTLRAKLLPHGRERRWSDRPSKPLESQVPSIVRRFEIIAHEAIADRAWSTEYQRVQEIAMRKAARRYQRELDHAEQVELLHDLVKDWDEVARMRRFLDALETQVNTGPPNAVMTAWVKWARTYCASIDPLSVEGLSELSGLAKLFAYDPIDDEKPDPAEQEWRQIGLLDDYME